MKKLIVAETGKLKLQELFTRHFPVAKETKRTKKAKKLHDKYY